MGKFNSLVKELNINRITLVKYLYSRKEVKYKSNIARNIWLFFHGFNSDKYIAYNLQENRELYLSDYRRIKTKFINGKFDVVLNNKLLFADAFSHVFNIPDNYALINKGEFIKTSKDSIICDIDSLQKYLILHNAVVIKPIEGGGGKSVYVIKYNYEKYFINNELIGFDKISDMVRKMDSYVVSEFIDQHSFSKKLFPDTTNTIRILLYRDIDDGKMKIAAASQRIGSKTSKGMDNISAGGVSGQIDIESGIIMKSTSIYKNIELRKISDYHPDTNLKLIGLSIPRWHSMTNEICGKLTLFPYIKYIGLDVVITEDGYSVIEGNNYSNPRVHQLNEPLLINPGYTRFLKSHGVL